MAGTIRRSKEQTDYAYSMAVHVFKLDTAFAAAGGIVPGEYKGSSLQMRFQMRFQRGNKYRLLV